MTGEILISLPFTVLMMYLLIDLNNQLEQKHLQMIAKNQSQMRYDLNVLQRIIDMHMVHLVLTN